MKSRRYPLLLVYFASIACCSTWVDGQTVISFDDLHVNNIGTFVPSGYQGLVWSNFACFNAVLYTKTVGNLTNGYYYGMVSPSNVVYNSFADTAEVDSYGTNFNFLSAYLTGAWNSNLNIRVQGYRDANLIYDETLVASATNPTLFTLNYLDVDRLTFSSFGGQDAGLGNGGNHFVMDNLTFEFIPEPSSLLLTALGGVSLAAFLRRKHR